MKDETVALIPGSLQIRTQPQQCAVVKAFPTVLPIDLSTLLEHATFGNSNVLAADMLLLRSLHNLRQANLESTRDDILHPPVHITNKITNSQNFTDSNLTKVQFLFKQGPGCWKCLQRLQNSTHHCTAHCTRKCKTWCSGRFRSWLMTFDCTFDAFEPCSLCVVTDILTSFWNTRPCQVPSANTAKRPALAYEPQVIAPKARKEDLSLARCF